MRNISLAFLTAALLSLSSCNAIMSNMDTFKSLAGKVVSAVSALGDTADKVGVGGGVLGQAKAAIDSATKTLGGLQQQMSALAKPDASIQQMLADKLSAPLKKTKASLEGAKQREPEVAASADSAIHVLKKIAGVFM